MRFRFLIVLVTAQMGFCPSSALAGSIAHEIAAAIARKNLAETVHKVEQYLDVKEVSNPQSSGGDGAKEFNANDGNSFLSNVTYHSYVWDYCLQWTGGLQCRQWLDPYVSLHGFQPEDKSPLEELVARFWQGMRGQAGGNSYSIWNIVKRAGGALLDRDGRLDRKDIVKWDLKPEVKQAIDQLGGETATRAVNITMNEDAKPQDAVSVAPPMEGLRAMASSWTKALRNRLVTNLGELRASTKGVEFALGEDIPDCDQYLAAVQRNPPKNGTDRGIRIDPQGRLEPETRITPMRDRYQRCVALRSAPVEMVNPKAEGRTIASGSPEDEQVDKWRSRINIGLIDQAGVDPNSFAKPGGVNLGRDEIANPIATYNQDAGQTIQVLTNAEQLQGYNTLLRRAAVGMKEVASRSPFIVDASADILARQLQPGTMSSIDINDLTPDMKSELKDTGLPRAQTEKSPQTQVERTPSQLTITSLK